MEKIQRQVKESRSWNRGSAIHKWMVILTVLARAGLTEELVFA